MAAVNETGRNLRIGMVVGVSLISLMLFLFFIGSEQKLFSKKNNYLVLLESVSGLAEGNPVHMSGVSIGVVQDIRLPQNPSDRQVKITIAVQKKYAERIRGDSRAKLRKLGLIAADSYIDITPGSPARPMVAPGSVIPAQKATDVDRLISSGEDLVENFVQISYSLKNILGRVDRGEGLLGELTTDPRSKQRITETVLTTLNKTNEILTHVQTGRGLIGRAVYDDAFGQELTNSLRASALSMQSILANLQLGVERGDGALPAMLSDPKGRDNVVQMLENLRLASENVATFTTTLKTGEGIVPRLMNDKQFADEALLEFRTLIDRLSNAARQINEGEGTVGRLIADPSIYESINDILIGINESKLLRWLVRNRQGAGIETRYDAATKKPAAPVVAPPPPASAPAPAEPQPEPPPAEISPSEADDAVVEEAPVVTPPPPAESEPAPPATSTADPPPLP
jgi:phospholipid/cholesterol/gamma-HCH transport system substrate-binding protein